LNSIEHIKNFNKQRYKERGVDTVEESKIIKWGKYTDVYNVYNIDTNDFEGILYIKGLKESKSIKKLLEGKVEVKIKCSYNHTFSKWQPRLE
jgi:hypothetical protein